MAMDRRATYRIMKTLLESALNDLQILAGDKIGPSTSSWQDVAGTCAVNLECLAAQLKQARLGNCESGITFPSPDEAIVEAANCRYEESV
jgi:hypothetical protein